jgi:hypothetical protein
LKEFPFLTGRLKLLTQINGTYIRQKGNRAGPFDLVGKGSLMLCTTPGQSSGNDFAALRDKISQGFRVLVINFKACIRAEPANFPAMIYSFFSSRIISSSGVSRRSDHFYASSFVDGGVLSTAEPSVSGGGTSSSFMAFSSAGANSFI